MNRGVNETKSIIVIFVALRFTGINLRFRKVILNQNNVKQIILKKKKNSPFVFTKYTQPVIVKNN